LRDAGVLLGQAADAGILFTKNRENLPLFLTVFSNTISLIA
jgi:hypothetical protein